VDTDERRPRTLAEEFDSRHNGLSTVRLVFATSVILWHSFPLTGHEIGYEPLRQVIANFRADGFFAISGFLILASWERRPSVRGYLRARLLRILPAYWFNLLMVAFVLAPLALWLSGGPVGSLFSGSRSSWHYVLANLDTRIRFFDIAGTPLGVPYPLAWNGSVWTLQWEMAAYAGLLLLAVLGLTRHRWVLLGLASSAWGLVLLSALDVVDPGGFRLGGIRFALMFLTGACLYAFADKVPMRGWLASVAVLAVLFGGYLADYRLIAAPALGYLVFWIGSRLRHPRWTRTTDISFGLFLFGFPVQQSLLVLGWPWLDPVAFFVVSWLATAPFALLCWYAVERPAMNLKKRLDRRAAGRSSGERHLRLPPIRRSSHVAAEAGAAVGTPATAEPVGAHAAPPTVT
jgi:peptidoglycan/LPS O-acetylase OafA/YrhL